VVCPRGHAFDLARQGYLNLVGSAPPGSADTSDMVVARERFLSGGHYRLIADQLAATVADNDPAADGGIVVDLAGGTGYYLGAVLDAVPSRFGLCLDVSAPALRRAARAHARAAAVGADAWRSLPLASASASTVLSAFGPRNPLEIERILAPGGVLVVVSPTAEHLQELIEPLGMLRVDPHKQQRQAAAFDRFHPVEQTTLTGSLTLDEDDVCALAAMGPTAKHVSAQTLATRLRALPTPTVVTLAVRITTYRAD
jgi:23S rRNA (guanine745-N1)-methyltransferase